MVVCDCVKCGGKDEDIFCENQLIEMKSGIYRSQKFNIGLFSIAVVLCAFGLFGSFH